LGYKGWKELYQNGNWSDEKLEPEEDDCPDHNEQWYSVKIVKIVDLMYGFVI
jgi:hypothetical protein